MNHEFWNKLNNLGFFLVLSSAVLASYYKTERFLKIPFVFFNVKIYRHNIEHFAQFLSIFYVLYIKVMFT